MNGAFGTLGQQFCYQRAQMLSYMKFQIAARTCTIILALLWDKLCSSFSGFFLFRFWWPYQEITDMEANQQTQSQGAAKQAMIYICGGWLSYWNIVKHELPLSRGVVQTLDPSWTRNDLKKSIEENNFDEITSSRILEG